MADEVSSFLAVLVLLVGLALSIVLVARAPAWPRLHWRALPVAASQGPVQRRIQSVSGPRALAATLAPRIAEAARAEIAARGLKEDDPRVPESVRRALAADSIDAWWRADARARSRAPAGVRGSLVWLAQLTSSADARATRYLEQVTRELSDWMVTE